MPPIALGFVANEAGRRPHSHRLDLDASGIWLARLQIGTMPSAVTEMESKSYPQGSRLTSLIYGLQVRPNTGRKRTTSPACMTVEPPPARRLRVQQPREWQIVARRVTYACITGEKKAFNPGL
jgi:hypothetical protein